MNDHSQTTPEKGPAFSKWQVAFLKELARKGNISAACRKAKIDRKWAYTCRDRDPFFKEAWTDALETAIDGIEEEAHRRAVTGVPEYEIVGEKKVLVGRKYSDTLMIVLLKAHRPAKFRENHRHEHIIPPVTVRPDFSKLSVAELKQLRELTAKMSGESEAAADDADTA